MSSVSFTSSARMLLVSLRRGLQLPTSVWRRFCDASSFEEISEA